MLIDLTKIMYYLLLDLFIYYGLFTNQIKKKKRKKKTAFLIIKGNEIIECDIIEIKLFWYCSALNKNETHIILNLKIKISKKI